MLKHKNLLFEIVFGFVVLVFVRSINLPILHAVIMAATFFILHVITRKLFTIVFRFIERKFEGKNKHNDILQIHE